MDGIICLLVSQPALQYCNSIFKQSWCPEEDCQCLYWSPYFPSRCDYVPPHVLLMLLLSLLTDSVWWGSQPTVLPLRNFPRKVFSVCTLNRRLCFGESAYLPVANIMSEQMDNIWGAKVSLWLMFSHMTHYLEQTRASPADLVRPCVLVMDNDSYAVLLSPSEVVMQLQWSHPSLSSNVALLDPN